MFVVIFEVEPRPEHEAEYLAQAARMRTLVETIDGFVDVERFRSRERAGRILSFSSWRDEAAVVRWREHQGHHLMQVRGRRELFADYRLRVGEVVPEKAPGVPGRDPGADGEASRLVRVTEVQGLDAGEADQRAVPGGAEAFASLYVPGKMLLLGPGNGGVGEESARGPDPAAAAMVRRRVVRVVRDYGLRERAEAPQRFADDP